jgi:hypothetical protein
LRGLGHGGSHCCHHCYGHCDDHQFDLVHSR